MQNAHLIMVADDGIRQGVHFKASTLMWRSARCKRAVNSTLAGETIAMSAALADAEWAQIMIQDILDLTVTVRDKTGGTLPFQVVLRSNCDVRSLKHPQQYEDGSNRSLDLTRYQRAQMRQDIQGTSGQGHQNFPSRHHQKEKCWDLLTPLRRCQVFQMKSRMPQSSLSIASECWTLERRPARGFIPNPSSSEKALVHRKSTMQNCWWERGTISFRTRQVHLSQRSWTERIL